MLSKKKKLNLSDPKARDFLSFYQEKKGQIRVLYRPSVNNNGFKVAVIVPKRLVQRAIERNKVRRLLFNEIKKHQLLNSPIELVIELVKNNNLSSQEIDLELIKENLNDTLFQVKEKILS